MKKRFFKTMITVFMFLLLLSQSVFAVTTQVIIQPESSKEKIYVSFKDSPIYYPECIYTGKKIKPEIIVKKQDGVIASPSEYKVTYDADCEKTGRHYIHVEYLKNGYISTLTYKVVPGLTTRVDMTVKDGKVTLSWAAVKGAVAYRVYKKNAEGRMVDIPLPNGEIAAEGLSRTFTDLEPGKTYEMGIMALDHIHSMPTDQLKTFKLTVPKSGQGSLNLVPGINPTTTHKPTQQTTVKATEPKTTQTETTTETTTATTIVTTENTTTETTTVKENTKTATEVMAESEVSTEKAEKDTSGMNKTVILLIAIAAVVVIGVIVASLLIRKKK